VSGAARRSARPAPSQTEQRIAGTVVGTVVAYERGEVTVSFGGSSAAARPLAALDDATLQRAAQERAEAVLLFEEGDPSRPLLVGVLRSRTPLVDALLAGPLPASPAVARVDGKRVAIEGKDEVVLQCGKASLTLRRDGKVVLRGVNLVTQADQVHKIRGGKVQVN
jgi:Domain of unknown function (DUF6484)